MVTRRCTNHGEYKHPFFPSYFQRTCCGSNPPPTHPPPPSITVMIVVHPLNLIHQDTSISSSLNMLLASCLCVFIYHQQPSTVQMPSCSSWDKVKLGQKDGRRFGRPTYESAISQVHESTPGWKQDNVCPY